MKKFLIALPCFQNAKGFCHRTVLVVAINLNEAISLARQLNPHSHIGECKEVTY
jgi:hypothetical protein